jgi:hypothetical protein
MPIASRPPVTHAHGSTVMRFCHSDDESPPPLQASWPSEPREKSRNFTPDRFATPRSASENCGTATVRPNSASLSLNGQPCGPCRISSIFSVSGEAYEVSTKS